MDYKWDWEHTLPWAWLGGIGMLGRLMYHAKMVQEGKRKPFSWVLLWDIPIAIGMGWIALGLATLTKLPWEGTISLGLAFAYLGPYTLDTIFSKWADWKFGRKGS